MLSSIILAIVGKLFVLNSIFYFPYFGSPFGLPKGYFPPRKELEGKRQIGSENTLYMQGNIEEDFLKSIHDA